MSPASSNTSDMSLSRTQDYSGAVSPSTTSPSSIQGPSPAKSTPSTIVGDRDYVYSEQASPTPTGPQTSGCSSTYSYSNKPRATSLPIRNMPTANNNFTNTISVANFPAYHLLYANDEAATVQFLLNGSPIQYKDLASNNPYITAIKALEPGPTIDYDLLPQHIRTLRATFSYTSEYRNLDTYFDNLLSLHEAWKSSAMIYFSYEVYCHMVHGLFITQSDPELLSLVRNMSAPALNIMRSTQARLCQPITQREMHAELSRRHANYTLSNQKLNDIKTTPNLDRNLKALNRATALHDQHIIDTRSSQAHAHAAAERNRKRIKSRMTTNIQSQFGMLGTQNMDPETEAAVLDVHKEGIENNMPGYSEEGWKEEEREWQRQRGEYKCLRGFEWRMDAWGEERGVGRDEEAGVWFGESRMDV